MDCGYYILFKFWIYEGIYDQRKYILSIDFLRAQWWLIIVVTQRESAKYEQFPKWRRCRTRLDCLAQVAAGDCVQAIGKPLLIDTTCSAISRPHKSEPVLIHKHWLRDNSPQQQYHIRVDLRVAGRGARSRPRNMHKRVYSSVERAVGGGKNAHSQAENRYDSYSSENERDP